MVIKSDCEWDQKVIVESFLQANVKARTKYKCCVLHHCLRENKITQDPYYIVKNIIQSILKTVPSLSNYMRLQDHEYFKEMTKIFGEKSVKPGETTATSTHDIKSQDEDILL